MESHTFSFLIICFSSIIEDDAPTEVNAVSKRDPIPCAVHPRNIPMSGFEQGIKTNRQRRWDARAAIQLPLFKRLGKEWDRRSGTPMAAS